MKLRCILRCNLSKIENNITFISIYLIKKIFIECFSLITVRYTAPVENIFWQREGMRPIGQKIVKLLCDMNFDANPIILHVFSNGGVYLYQYIDLAIKEFQTPLDVRNIQSIEFFSEKLKKN